jgi:hypothetical protein
MLFVVVVLCICLPIHIVSGLCQQTPNEQGQVTWDSSSVPKDAFSECSELKEFIMKSGVELTEIGENAFIGSGLKIFTVPKTLTTIGSGAFQNCIDFKTLEIPDSPSSPSELTTIGPSAFRSTALQSVVIPNSVVTISEYAFTDCKALTSVTISISSNLINIEEGAFSGSGIISFYYPEKVNDMSERTFQNCKSLSEITFSASSTISSIGAYACSGCEALSVFAVPSSVTVINEFAFYMTTELKSVSFPSTSKLERIGLSSFQQSGLVKFTLPKSCTYINTEAFYGCKELKKLEMDCSMKNYRFFAKDSLAGTGMNMLYIKKVDQSTCGSDQCGTICGSCGIKTYSSTSLCNAIYSGNPPSGNPSGTPPSDTSSTSGIKPKSNTGKVLVFLVVAFGFFFGGGYYTLIYLPEKQKAEVLAARDTKLAKQKAEENSAASTNNPIQGGINPMNNA